MEIRPSNGPLGTEISGVDLALPLDGATVRALRKALLDHLVIVFRDQRITVEQHKAFARQFGPLHTFRFVTAGNLEGHPEVVHVLKKKQDRQVFGGQWHADLTFLENPVLGSVLHAIETPEKGGDTLFANMYLVYASLSEVMQGFVETLVGIHESDVPEENVSGRAGSGDGRLVRVSTEHPVVARHPETGRKLLFVNRTYTTRLKGMTGEESRAILKLLFQQAARAEVVWRLHWRPGTVAFWDNRCTQHLPLNDYHGQRREMHRVTVQG